MHDLKNTTRHALVAAAMLLPMVAAHAVDGVMLIDQNRALAGNVTPGDAAGFPITISQPGSYRLAGNLMPPAFLNAIEVTASDVTIDLNGFSLIAVPHDASQADAGVTLRGTGVQGLTLMNGSISGFTQPLSVLVALGPEGVPAVPLTLKNLVLRVAPAQGVTTLLVPPFSRIEGLVGPNIFVDARCPSLVVNSVVRTLFAEIVQSFPNARCTFVNNATL